MTTELKNRVERIMSYCQTQADIYNNYQLGTKVVINGIYGAFGFSGFYFYNKNIAEAVTKQGKHAILNAESIINKWAQKVWLRDKKTHKLMGVAIKPGYENIKIDSITRYIDTDSLTSSSIINILDDVIIINNTVYNLDDKINDIHIIWLGEKPIYDKYFDSIKTFLPDFNIKIWRDEDCMHYINECEYAKRHYSEKNYAYVSDYVRFRILYEFGGMYIDTDVEFASPLSDVVADSVKYSDLVNYHLNRNNDERFSDKYQSDISLRDAVNVLQYNTEYPVSLLDSDVMNATVDSNYKREVLDSSEISIKYKGYIQREQQMADKIMRLENLIIPEGFDFDRVESLSIECRQKLKKYSPRTIAQASRISGVSPADISVLLVYFGNLK